MSKGPNSTKSTPFKVTVSQQSWLVLQQLAERGIYGRNPAEVAARFIDEQLKNFVETPKFAVDGSGQVREVK